MLNNPKIGWNIPNIGPIELIIHMRKKPLLFFDAVQIVYALMNMEPVYEVHERL